MDPYLRALQTKLSAPRYTQNADHEIEDKLTQLFDAIKMAPKYSDAQRKYAGKEAATLVNYIESRIGEYRPIEFRNFEKFDSVRQYFHLLRDDAFEFAAIFIFIQLLIVMVTYNVKLIMASYNVGIPITIFITYIHYAHYKKLKGLKLSNSTIALYEALENEECKAAQKEYTDAHNEYINSVNHINGALNRVQLDYLIEQVKLRGNLQTKRDALYKAADVKVDNILSHDLILEIARMILLMVVYGIAAVIIM